MDTSAPTVTLNAPPSRSNDPTPSFTGTSDEASEVVIHIFDESKSEVAKATAPGIDGSWTSGEASPALPDGRYRAVASQESLFGNAIGETDSFSFTIDTVPPQVTVSYPADHSATSSQSQLVTGSASTAEHDLPGVIVQLYSGSSITGGQAPLQSIAVNAALANTSWQRRSSWSRLIPDTHAVGLEATVRSPKSPAARNRTEFDCCNRNWPHAPDTPTPSPRSRPLMRPGGNRDKSFAHRLRSSIAFRLGVP